MSTYQQKQHALFAKLEENFKKGKQLSTLVEPVSDYAHDNRLCLTSVVFVPKEVQEIIFSKVISPLKRADGRQYFYLPESLHLTIQNIRIVNDPPLFNTENIKEATLVFREVITRFKKLNLEIKNLLELPTSISLCTYSDRRFHNLVFELRDKLKKSGVPDNKGYAAPDIVFGNITVCRYTSTPSKTFLEEVARLKNVFIGNLEISTIALIITNSVCHPDKTRIIEEFHVG